MIVNYSDKYDILATDYSVSAREYFEILRLAILHVDKVWEDTAYKVATHETSDEVYKCAIRIINLLHRVQGFEKYWLMEDMKQVTNERSE